jgi:hypothetical protein
MVICAYCHTLTFLACRFQQKAKERERERSRKKKINERFDVEDKKYGKQKKEDPDPMGFLYAAELFHGM